MSPETSQKHSSSSGKAAQRFVDQPERLAHLWLVPNPPFHPTGDFGISADGLGLDGPGPDGQRWTYANLALMRRALCAHVPVGQKLALGPLLFAAMREQRIGAQLYTGAWHNVGTPAQLDALNATAATS
jgi:MurNAc alpha-1-phosphate uridylyltransferase